MPNWRIANLKRVIGMEIESGLKEETIELLRSKTFRAAVVGIGFAIAGLASKTIDLQSGIELIFGAVVAVTIRHSLAKLGPVMKPGEDALIEKFIGDLAESSERSENPECNSDANDDSDSADRRALNLGGKS